MSRPFNVCVLRDYTKSDGTEGTEWRQVGIAWPHKNGPGFNVELLALPVDGKLVIVPPKENNQQGNQSYDSPPIEDDDIPF